MNDREAENIYDDWFGLPHMDLLFHDPAQTHWRVIIAQKLSSEIFPENGQWLANVWEEEARSRFAITTETAPAPDQALYYAVAKWCKRKMEVGE